jgi:hypothetical protein
MCVREVICTVRPNLEIMPSLCHRQSEAYDNSFGIHYKAQVHPYVQLEAVSIP